MLSLVIDGIVLDVLDIQRFQSKIIRGGEDECWEWMHGRTKSEYGHFDAKGRSFRAHRIMYALETKEDISEWSILHTCDNPPCCNPKHLFRGTQLDNMTDCLKKGRHHDHFSTLIGELQPTAKLTEKEVKEIREKRSSGKTLKELAKEYGVYYNAIWSIVNRKTWKHI